MRNRALDGSADRTDLVIVFVFTRVEFTVLWLAGRSVPPLARASARERAYADDGTNDETSTRRDAPTPQPVLSDEEREAIRQAGAEDARRSRAEHGFPERIEDLAAVARLAAILRDIPAPRPPSESSSDETNPAARMLAADTLIRIRASAACVSFEEKCLRAKVSSRPAAPHRMIGTPLALSGHPTRRQGQ